MGLGHALADYKKGIFADHRLAIVIGGEGRGRKGRGIILTLSLTPGPRTRAEGGLSVGRETLPTAQLFHREPGVF